MLIPKSSVLIFLKYVYAFANPIISVVQTGVKSPGWEKNTSHLPL